MNEFKNLSEEEKEMIEAYYEDIKKNSWITVGWIFILGIFVAYIYFLISPYI